MATDFTAVVHPEGYRGGEPRQENTDDNGTATPGPKVTFHPGQRVELAVQVGSWPEGTTGQILGPCAEGSAYEWDVQVHREVGPVRVGLYEHELREPSASLIERLVARTDDEWLVGFKDWNITPNINPYNYFWGGPVIADGEAVGSADGSGTDGPWSVPRDPFGAAVDALYAEAQELLLSKHQDYGPKNISQAPGGALNGLRVRIWDKVARLNHLTSEGASPNHEGLRDTLLDLANYALIGCLVLNDNWPSD